MLSAVMRARQAARGGLAAFCVACELAGDPADLDGPRPHRAGRAATGGMSRAGRSPDAGNAGWHGLYALIRQSYDPG